jgi:glutamine amidotransferase
MSGRDGGETVIVIVDYGVGNLGSLRNMLKKIGREATVSQDPQVVGQADKIILPGVGSFDHAITNLRRTGLVPVLDDCVRIRKIPVLGVCLGMQLMTGGSEEGELPGLGWLDAGAVRFRFDGSRHQLKVPHMGWNTVRVRGTNPIFAGMPEGSRFYFVHSYHVRCRVEADVLATTDYGGDFVSAFARENIIGVQFHPEKSHRFGMHLLRNFVEQC